MKEEGCLDYAISDWLLVVGCLDYAISDWLLVVGCLDYAPVYGATLIRHGDDVTIQCNQSGEEFRMKCVGNGWTGVSYNCSEPGNFEARFIHQLT